MMGMAGVQTKNLTISVNVILVFWENLLMLYDYLFEKVARP